MAGKQTYTVADIARELGVTKMTVRNWSARYAEHLSDDAVPQPGEQRQFTARDRVVLAYINQLVNEGHRHGFIALRIGETTFTDDEYTEADLLAHATESPHATTDEHHAALAPRVDVADIAAIISTTAAQFESRIADHDRRLAEVESRSRLIVGIAAGFVVGAVLVAIVAMLIMLR